MPQILVAFDLYGTLLSTESIAKILASHFGQEKAASVAAVWRKYQLEYTWRLNSMSMDFSRRNDTFASLIFCRAVPAFLRHHPQKSRPCSERAPT